MKEKKNGKKFIEEFKTFVMRGSVIDLAVGVIIGAAFQSIVSSLVNDVIMPLIGIIIGGIDFTSLSITVGNSNIMYGNFIQAIVSFLIIAFCIFVVVKVINKITHKKEKEEAKKKADDILLLEEIRDLLKEQNKSNSKLM